MALFVIFCLFCYLVTFGPVFIWFIIGIFAGCFHFRQYHWCVWRLMWLSSRAAICCCCSGRVGGKLLWFRRYLNIIFGHFLATTQTFILTVWWISAWLKPFVAACLIWCHTLLWIPSESIKHMKKISVIFFNF